MTFIKNRIFLFIVLAVFIALKIPHLHYAYYWDESWPYAAAITDLYHHGISLAPDAIDAELSRGHPLFFHATAASWMSIFGRTHIAMHSFALLIAVLFLIAIYETGIRLFNPKVAALAVLMVATQEMFFVQSSMLLLEVLVAFLCFMSLSFYVAEKYFFTALSLTMLFYTKESGLVMGFVLGVDALAGLLRKNAGLRKKLMGLASVGIPVILIAIYFAIQKHVRGWYIFPFYAGLVQHNWNNFWYDFRMNAVRSVFYDYEKYRYFLLLGVVALIAAARQRSYRPLALLLPLICIYYFVDDKRAGRLLPGIPFFIVFIGSVLLFLYAYARLGSYNKTQQKFIVLSGLFILCFLIFSATNFFTPRYMMAAMMPMFFISAVFFDALATKINSWVYYPIAAVVLCISAYAFKTNNNFGDCDLGAFDAMYVQQKLTDYLEDNVGKDKYISCGPFIELQHLVNPATGYLHSDSSYKHVTWDIGSQTAYILFDNIEPDARRETVKNDSSFLRIFRAEKGSVWGEIYKRK